MHCPTIALDTSLQCPNQKNQPVLEVFFTSSKYRKLLHLLPGATFCQVLALKTVWPSYEILVALACTKGAWIATLHMTCVGCVGLMSHGGRQALQLVWLEPLAHCICCKSLALRSSRILTLRPAGKLSKSGLARALYLY